MSVTVIRVLFTADCLKEMHINPAIHNPSWKGTQIMQRIKYVTRLFVLNLFIALGLNDVLQINNTEKGVSKQLNQVETHRVLSVLDPRLC